MSKVVNSLNIYVLLWFIEIQNASMSLVPDSISVLLLFFLFVWSFFCVFKVQYQARNIPFIGGLNSLLLLFSIYGLFRVIGGEQIIAYLGSGRAIGPREYLIEYWRSILPIYAFLYYSIKGQITEKTLLFWLIVFTIGSVCNYYYEENNRLAMIAAGSAIDGVTNNQSYSFVALMAFLPFLEKRPLVQYSLLSFFVLFTIMGMKRGAILVGILCIVLFLCRSYRQAKNFQKVTIVLFSIVTVFIGYLVVMWYIQNNVYFMTRVEDTLNGVSSGRDAIYKKLWDYFTTDMGIVQILFGLGADGTFRAIGQAGHNDWIEVLIDTGILGLSLYVLYWFKVAKTWILAKRFLEEKIYLCIMIIFASLLIKTAFSMSINDIKIYTSMPLGYCISKFLVSNRKQAVHQIEDCV